MARESRNGTGTPPGAADDGRVVAGRYRLGEPLGSGGMGRVWRAEDALLGRTVAVKEIDFPPYLEDSEREALRRRTLREARAAARLDHPNVVRVYDVVEEDGRPYLVLEHVPSRTLAQAVREDGPMPPAEAARIGVAVLDALAAAHAGGVVHRDVKPGNVLLGDGQAAGRVVLTDFGIARSTGDATVTSAGVLLGSPAYMSPERARGEQPGPPADLWALGATLYSAVEGRPPFDAEQPLGVLHRVISDPADAYAAAGSLAPVLDALLEKDPARRADVPTARRMLLEVARGGGASLPATAPLSDPYPDLGGGAAGATSALHGRSLPPAGPRVPGVPTGPMGAAAGVAGAAVAAAPVGAAALLDDRSYGAARVEEDRTPGARASRGALLAGVAALAGVLGVGGIAVLASDGEDPASGDSPRGTAAGASTAPRPTAPAATGPAGSSAPAPAASVATEPAASAAPGPTASAGPTTEPDPAAAETSAGSRDATAADPAAGPGGAASGTPEGWSRYAAPLGWSVAHPADWRVRVLSAERVRITGPSGAYLLVETTGDPKPSAEGAWREYEPAFASRHEGYERIRIETVDYRDYDAADWEFSYASGGARLHALNRGFVVGGERAYALYTQTRASAWSDEGADLAASFARTFRPA